jgi:hypothetical protein
VGGGGGGLRAPAACGLGRLRRAAGGAAASVAGARVCAKTALGLRQLRARARACACTVQPAAAAPASQPRPRRGGHPRRAAPAGPRPAAPAPVARTARAAVHGGVAAGRAGGAVAPRRPVPCLLRREETRRCCAPLPVRRGRRGAPHLRSRRRPGFLGRVGEGRGPRVGYRAAGRAPRCCLARASAAGRGSAGALTCPDGSDVAKTAFARPLRAWIPAEPALGARGGQPRLCGPSKAC